MSTQIEEAQEMAEPRVVVVTGASAGLGRAISRAFAARTDKVALLARDADGLYATAKDVETAMGTPLVVPTDTAHWDQVLAAARRVEDEPGPIDVRINNAMTSVFADVPRVSSGRQYAERKIRSAGRVLPRLGRHFALIGSSRSSFR